MAAPPYVGPNPVEMTAGLVGDTISADIIPCAEFLPGLIAVHLDYSAVLDKGGVGTGSLTLATGLAVGGISVAVRQQR